MLGLGLSLSLGSAGVRGGGSPAVTPVIASDGTTFSVTNSGSLPAGTGQWYYDSLSNAISGATGFTLTVAAAYAGGATGGGTIFYVHNGDTAHPSNNCLLDVETPTVDYNLDFTSLADPSYLSGLKDATALLTPWPELSPGVAAFGYNGAYNDIPSAGGLHDGLKISGGLLYRTSETMDIRGSTYYRGTFTSTDGYRVIWKDVQLDNFTGAGAHRWALTAAGKWISGTDTTDLLIQLAGT